MHFQHDLSFFTAAVSLSGIPQFDHVAELSNIPIWLMHGSFDRDNPPAGNEQFYKEVGVKNNTLFWKFEGIEHDNIFSPIILGENIPRWLFAKRKKSVKSVTP